MASSRWPLAELRLQTPELELRWPSQDDLYALADLAAAGVHDPEVQPFMVAWTDASPEERARSTLEWHLVRDRPALTRRLRLDRADWQAAQTIPVQIHGLPPCLPLFGRPADS